MQATWRRTAGVMLLLAATASAQLVICGDPDGNQQINVLDSLLVARAAVGLATLTATQQAQADVTNDRIVGIMDALRIARFIVLFDSTLTCTTSATRDCSMPFAPITDFMTTEVQINVANTGAIRDNVAIEVDIEHTGIGDLVVTILHPDGTAVLLHNRTGGPTDDIVETYPTTLEPRQSLSMLNGKPANGVWVLRVRDSGALDVGQIRGWCVDIDSNPATASTSPYAVLVASRTGNNLLHYPYARPTGGGLPENTIQFSASSWSRGPNHVAEAGGGDDTVIGPVAGGAWSTDLVAAQGTIHAVSGLFTAGTATGRGFVSFVHPVAGSGQSMIAVTVPDWIP